MQLLLLSVYEGPRAEGAAGGVRETDPGNDSYLGGETQEDRGYCTGDTHKHQFPLSRSIVKTVLILITIKQNFINFFADFLC